MKLSYTDNQASVNYATAKQRALARLRQQPVTRAGRTPLPAALVAHSIWPNHEMHAQGAGGAASRILKRMAREKLVEWTCIGGRDMRQWGWRLV